MPARRTRSRLHHWPCSVLRKSGRNHTPSACGTQTRSSSGTAAIANSLAANGWAEPFKVWYIGRFSPTADTLLCTEGQGGPGRPSHHRRHSGKGQDDGWLEELPVERLHILPCPEQEGVADQQQRRAVHLAPALL